jgi:hypothetical protein
MFHAGILDHARKLAKEQNHENGLFRRYGVPCPASEWTIGRMPCEA